MPMAVIPYSSGVRIDRFMAGAASWLKAQCLRLGVVQYNDGACEQGRPSMALENRATGARLSISESRSPGAAGSRLCRGNE